MTCGRSFTSEGSLSSLHFGKRFVRMPWQLVHREVPSQFSVPDLVSSQLINCHACASEAPAVEAGERRDADVPDTKCCFLAAGAYTLLVLTCWGFHARFLRRRGLLRLLRKLGRSYESKESK